MKRILLTGAAGFIGRHVSHHLKTSGHHIVAVVRNHDQAERLSGSVDSCLIKTIDPLVSWDNELQGIDTVIHLAGRAHVMREKCDDPLLEFRVVNVIGTERMAAAAVKAGVRRLIFISSIGVNGGTSRQHPFTESDTPQPQTFYAQSKLEAEEKLKTIAGDNLELVIIRPPLVYGPGNPGNFLSLLKIVARGMPLPLATLDNKKSLIYVENLAHAIIACVDHSHAAGQTYLVSDGEDVSTPELIRRIAAALGKPARLFPFPSGLLRFSGKLLGKSSTIEQLIGSLQVDSSKIRRDLGWKPIVSMEQGLAETAAWFMNSGARGH